MKSKSICRTSILCGGALCLGLIPQMTMGSAWTRADGDLLFLTPVSYVYADEAFDENGDRVDRNRFEMAEFSPLIEYGVTDYFTVGVQPKYRRVWLETDQGVESNEGLAEADVFGRLRLWHRDRASISIQGLIKAPINPDEEDVAALGRDQVDGALKLTYGNRHVLRGGRIFYSAEVGYRKRENMPADQASVNAFFGWSPFDSSWSYILRSANTLGIGNDDGDTEVLTTRPDFTRHDVQLMASYRFRSSLSIVGGMSSTVAGENVGVGNTAFLAVSKVF